MPHKVVLQRLGASAAYWTDLAPDVCAIEEGGWWTLALVFLVPTRGLFYSHDADCYLLCPRHRSS